MSKELLHDRPLTTIASLRVTQQIRQRNPLSAQLCTGLLRKRDVLH